MPGRILTAGRVPARGGGPALEVGVEGLAFGERLLGGEHRLGVAGREVPAVRRDDPACTSTGWPCGERGHVQRAADTEELAAVVDRRGPCPPAAHTPALLVGEHRVVFPAVPELAGDLDELVGPLVALRVRGLCVAGRSYGRRRRRPW